LYLIVFTRKRLLPLVRRFSPLLPSLAVTVLIGLAAAVVWLQLRSAELREQTARLAGQISGYDSQLAEVRTDTQLTSEQLESDILIDLHPPPATLERTGPYAIQLASLHSRAEALRMAGGLSGTVGRELVVQRAVLDSGPWYRVLIEPFPGDREAQAYADSLRAAGKIRDFVLQRLPDDWRSDPDYTLISN
jgi:hypothetical protein